MGASASKSVTLTNNYGYGFTLTASFVENSINVAGNTSNITCTATFTSGASNWETGSPSTLSIYWHDNKENYNRYVASIEFAGIGTYTTKQASGTVNVTHADNGLLSGYVYAIFDKGATTTGWACNSGGVVTDMIALTTIPRASTPTVTPSTFNIGDTITINTNRKSTAFTHTLIFYFGNYSYQIATGVEDTITFDTSIVANEMYQQIPNASAGQGNVTAITYNGSTQVGTKNVLFEARVTNSNPTFNASYGDINPTTTAITNNNQQIIRNNSNLQIVVSNTSAKNYATLSTLTAVINGTSYTGDLRGTGGTIDVGTVNLSSNTTAQVVLTDSRGISTTKNLDLIILDWVLPTAIISLQRQNNYYSETDINVNADYSSLDNKNTITIKVRTKKVSDSTYGSYTTLQDNVTTTLTLDNNYAWDVQVLLQDKIGSTTYNLTIDRGIPITYFDRLKRSVGINCFPADNESLEVSGNNILNRILGYGQPASAVSGDWNSACGTASGFYMGNGLSNSPTGATVDNWWWVIHIVHNATYQRQIAFSFLNNSQIFTRIQNNGNWNSWTQLGDVYATSEVDTGSTDANGNTIYRQVYTGTKPTGQTSMTIPLGIGAVNSIWVNHSKSYVSNTTTNTFISLSQYSSSTDWVRTYFTGDTLYLELGSVYNTIELDLYIVIEYTKQPED